MAAEPEVRRFAGRTCRAVKTKPFSIETAINSATRPKPGSRWSNNFGRSLVSILVSSRAHRRESLWDEFTKILGAAGIHLSCRGKHECTPVATSTVFTTREGPLPRLTPDAFCRHPTIPDAAQSLRHDAEVHQHGRAIEPGGRESLRAGSVTCRGRWVLGRRRSNWPLDRPPQLVTLKRLGRRSGPKILYWVS